MTRTSSATVVFQRPFVLTGFDNMQPAGSYIVDTEEEQVDSLVVNAWRRMATTMRLPQPGGAIEYVPLDPNALQDALIRDRAQEHGGEIAKMPLDRARAGPDAATLSMLRPKK